MEKNCLIIDEKNLVSASTLNNKNVEAIYCIDNPFKEYLFDMAVQNNCTNIKNRTDFDHNMEVYKLLKRVEYFVVDKVNISFLSGETYTFTKEEAKMVTDNFEKKIDYIKTLLNEAKERLKMSSESEGKRNKVVVYTCITGGYDNILEPTNVTSGVDYICFTDNLSMKSKTWKMRPIPDELLKYSKVKQQRGVKILAHKYLKDYDISVWVDGAVIVRGNINDYLKTLDFKQYSVFVPEHPSRKCIYAEKEACVKLKKIKGDEIELTNRQMERYKKEGFPTNFGLVQTNVMIRRHNDPYSVDLMEKWWSELKDYCHRDQLSFNYAVWKIGDRGFKYLGKTTCNSKFFNWIKKHNK